MSQGQLREGARAPMQRSIVEKAQRLVKYLIGPAIYQLQSLQSEVRDVQICQKSYFDPGCTPQAAASCLSRKHWGVGAGWSRC